MNRTWTYIISKKLDAADLAELLASGRTFVASWTAHENKLSATFEIFRERMIIVRVNEDVNGASGCSIDKLTRFIKETETKYSIELLNRMLVAYKNGGDVNVVHASGIKELLTAKVINEDTVIYNTSASNENELLQWEQPLKNTWLSKYLEKV